MRVRIETDIPGYTVRIGAGGIGPVPRGVTPLDIDLPAGRHLIQLVGWRDVEPRGGAALLAMNARTRAGFLRQGRRLPAHLQEQSTRQEVRTNKFITASTTAAEFRTAHRQGKANTEAEQAAGWRDPMMMFSGVTEPSYGSIMSAAGMAALEANEPFTFVPFEQDASFGSTFGIGSIFGPRPTAVPVTPSTDNSPVVLRWTVKPGVDKTEARPVVAKVKAAAAAVTGVPAAIGAAVETAKAEGGVEAAKQNPLLAAAAGVGGTLGVLGLLKWLRGRRS